MKNKSYLFSTFILSIFLFTACDPSFWGDPNDDPFGEGSYIATNAEDPEFVRLETDDGEVVSVFGERDADGLPEFVRIIDVTNNIGERNQLFFNDNGDLETSIADNGTIFNYEWQADGTVAISIACKDGVNQISLVLDPQNIETDDQGKSACVSNVQLNSNVDECSQIEFYPIGDQFSKQQAIGYLGDATVHELRVTSCDQPDNTYITGVYLYDQGGGKKLKELIARQTSTGVYKITVPSGSAPEISAQLIAERLTSVLAAYCDKAAYVDDYFTTAMCAGIAAKLAATGVGASVAPGVGTACFGITAAMGIYCNTLGLSAPGEKSYMDKLNDQKLLKHFTIKDEYMKVKIHFPALPSDIVFEFEVADETPSVLIAELNQSSDPKIKALSTYPFSPAYDQGYTVKANMFCLPIGSTVTFSGIGSDGWMDEDVYQISSEAQSSGIFEMNIAGRQQREQDVIMVSVHTPWNEEISKEIAIAFKNQGNSGIVDFKPYRNFYFHLTACTNYGSYLKDDFVLKWNKNNFSATLAKEIPGASEKKVTEEMLNGSVSKNEKDELMVSFVYEKVYQTIRNNTNKAGFIDSLHVKVDNIPYGAQLYNGGINELFAITDYYNAALREQIPQLVSYTQYYYHGKTLSNEEYTEVFKNEFCANPEIRISFLDKE